MKNAANSWIVGNWEKVLGAFLAVVVAGVIGFYTEIIHLNDEIAHLRERIIQLESERKLYETKEEMQSLSIDVAQIKTTVTVMVMPKIELINNHETAIKVIQSRGDHVFESVKSPQHR